MTTYVHLIHWFLQWETVYSVGYELRPKKQRSKHVAPLQEAGYLAFYEISAVNISRFTTLTEVRKKGRRNK
jgi:hypothetical protein